MFIGRFVAFIASIVSFNHLLDLAWWCETPAGIALAEEDPAVVWKAI